MDLVGIIPNFYNQDPDADFARTKIVNEGIFVCPVCQQLRAFQEKEVQQRYYRGVLLFCLPLFPVDTTTTLGVNGNYVQCLGCKSKLVVGSEWRRPQKERFRARRRAHVRRRDPRKDEGGWCQRFAASQCNSIV